MPRDSLFALGKTLLLAYTSPGHMQMKMTALMRDFIRIFVLELTRYYRGPAGLHHCDKTGIVAYT